MTTRTINGHTYDFFADFDNYGFREKFPLLIDDILVVCEQASTAALESKTNGGFTYVFESTTTNADPGTGKLKFNHATIASATAMYISKTTAADLSIGTILATWDDSTSTIRGQLKVTKQEDATVYAQFNITGSLTDNTTWDAFTISYVGGAGALEDDDDLVVQFIRNGDKGDTGATGSTGADGSGFTRAPTTSTGSANAYVLTFGTPISNYADQQTFVFEANFSNTGPATLNIDGKGDKSIRKNFDELLVADDIKTGQLIQVSYEAGTDRFQMMNNPGNIFTTEREAATVAGNLYVQDYVIGYFDYDATLSYASLVGGSGSGNVSLYLSPNRTSASGTVITGASGVAVSTTLASGSLTANNTVAAASPRYLIAKCTSSTALTNLIVSLKVIKNMDD